MGDAAPLKNSPALQGAAARDWFAAEGSLIEELKRSRPALPATPSIEGYSALTELRRGGQGVVYSAVQTSTNRKVAIKLMLDSLLGSPLSRRRFEREVDLVAGLRHPGIVRVYDSGITGDGRPYLVMEFVEGQSLDAFIAAAGWRTGGRDGVRATVALLADVAAAVSFAHQRGVIHRDLKPSNIRVTGDATGVGGAVPVVLDFGLAKAASAAENRPAVTASGSGGFMGSLAWASPEQARGDQAHVDVRTDVYALGVLLFSALTGRFPYDVTGPLGEVLRRIEHEGPISPRGLRAEIDEDLATIVLCCLAKDPSRRYQSAAGLEGDLRAYLLGEPVAARADSSWYLVRTAVRRNKGAVAVAAGIVAMVGVFGVVMAGLYAKATRAERSASEQLADANSAKAFLRDVLASPDPASRGRDAKVIDLLERTSKRLLEDKSLAPKSLAEMKVTLGSTYFALGEFERARVFFEEAVRVLGGAVGEADPKTLAARVLLAAATFKMGDLENAERMVRSVAALAVGLLPEERVKINAGQTLGVVLLERGKPKEAEQALRAALAECQLAPGAAGDLIAQITNDLAITLRRQTRLDEAEKLYREQLALVQSKLGADSPLAIGLRINLGSLLQEQGSLDDAEATDRKALEDARRVLGPRHDDTITVLLNLSTLMSDRGRFDEAEPLNREGLKVLTEAYGAENPTTLTAQNNFGKLLERLGKLDEAEAMLADVVEKRGRVLGKEHAHTLIAMGNFGSVLVKRGRFEEALANTQKIIAIQERTLGENHLDTTISRNNLAMQLSSVNRLDEALPHFEKAAGKAAELLKPENWIIGLFRGNYGRALAKVGRMEEAEREQRASYAVLKAALGEKDGRFLQTAKSLAELLRQMGREQEADAILPAAAPSATK